MYLLKVNAKWGACMYDRFLPAFIAVAECGSLTSAADRLFLTPSAVMKQMNALEQRLGVKLLVRGSHGVQLTEAGKYVYAEAGKAISQGEAVMKRARDIEHGSEKIIRIGSSFLNPGQVLIDLWDILRHDGENFSFKIIPYSDERGQILSVVASLGSSMDFMVGVFGSRRMQQLAGFCPLGSYSLCVAVPKNHRLAGRRRLEIEDMYGESLIIVRDGDAIDLYTLREALQLRHPQIKLVETDYFYDMETFNLCELTGSLLLTFNEWRGVHPALVTIPVNWPFTVPYGLLYSRDISGAAACFLDIIRRRMAGENK